MLAKLGVQYYVLVGLGLGVVFSSVLALTYIGKASFVGTNLNELLTTPRVILIAPAAVGLIIGVVLLIFASGRRTGRNVPAPLGGAQPLLGAEVSAIGFGLGIFLGLIAALVIFFVAPFSGRGFLSHIFFGIVFGGSIGAVVGPLSQKIDQWLSED